MIFEGVTLFMFLVGAFAFFMLLSMLFVPEIYILIPCFFAKKVAKRIDPKFTNAKYNLDFMRDLKNHHDARLRTVGMTLQVIIISIYGVFFLLLLYVTMFRG